MGLLAAWKRDGLLPINGRTITPVFRVSNVTSAEQQRKSCVEMAQQEKPFLVVAGPGVGAAGLCLAQEFKMQVVSAGQTTDNVISTVYPNWLEVAPTLDRLLRNNAHWAKANGLLDGKKIGIYSYETEEGGRAVDAFQKEVAKLGGKVVIDMSASGTQGLGSTSGSDAVAVQQFRSAGADVAFLFTSALGFQAAAQAQGYRPAYPIVDTGYNHTDAAPTSS